MWVWSVWTIKLVFLLLIFNLLFFYNWVFLVFFFFYFIILYWFCHTSTCIRHGCTCVPSPKLMLFFTLYFHFHFMSNPFQSFFWMYISSTVTPFSSCPQSSSVSGSFPVSRLFTSESPNIYHQSFQWISSVYFL